jgi:hypothetical protein
MTRDEVDIAAIKLMARGPSAIAQPRRPQGYSRTTAELVRAGLVQQKQPFKPRIVVDNVAAELATLELGDVKSQRRGGDTSPPSLSNTEAAALVGVNRDTVKNAKTVLRNGTPEEVQAVKEGKMAVGTVAKLQHGGDRKSEIGDTSPLKKTFSNQEAATMLNVSRVTGVSDTGGDAA